MLLKIAGPGLIILLLHILATILGWYEAIYWLDSPMHFLGGASIGIAAYYLLNYAGVESKQFHPKLMEIFLIISITALCAVAWEVMEFNFDFFFKTDMQPGMIDTMKDLCLGLLGGATAALIAIKKKTA